MRRLQYRLLYPTLSLLLTWVIITLLNLGGYLSPLNLYVFDRFNHQNTEQSAQFSIVIPPPSYSEHSEFFANLNQAAPNHIFWVLPDKPLTETQTTLIEKFQLETIKIPSQKFASNGEIYEVAHTAWQPSAGYLTSISQQLGVSRTIPRQLDNEITPHAMSMLVREAIEAPQDSFIDFG